MIVCAKCKNPSNQTKSGKLRSSDYAHKMFCYPCYTRLEKHRAKRGLDMNLRPIREEVAK